MSDSNNVLEYENIDTGRTLTFSDDTDELLGALWKLVLITIFFISLSIFSYNKFNPFEIGLFATTNAALLFGVGLAIYRIFFKRRSVVISPDGIEDSGITIEKVPWAAVNTVELATMSRTLTGQQPLAVLLRLKPRASDTLKLTRRGRKLFLNKNVLWIPVGGGMIVDGYPQNAESFLKTIEAYARTYGKEVT